MADGRSELFWTRYQGVGCWYLQIVTGTTPSTRGKLPTPDTPRTCPADIWDLIQQCLVLDPAERPSAKQVGNRHKA